MVDEIDIASRVCPVCGGREFAFSRVIWPELAAEWRLEAEEVAYIDRQQGAVCCSCGMNFRSLALAEAIRRWVGSKCPLRDALLNRKKPLRVLEINEAGNLTPLLKSSTEWTLASYPEIDIHHLPYENKSFDLVVHSDTLEHVEMPVRGLQECRRVLRDNGACCYTVPMIVGRLTSSRRGLRASYHGARGERRPDFMVHTEFGADAWTLPIRAGFDQVTMTSFEYPAALAFTCQSANTTDTQR
jgi:SAM-dependent methyltransferase